MCVPRHCLAILLVTATAWAEEMAPARVHAALFQRCAPAVVGLECRAGNAGYFGTGAVITADGLILTSTTVVPAQGAAIRVIFTDGAIRTAKVVESDARTESTLIQVEATGLQFLALADTDDCRVGDPVYSWGNPFGTISQDGTVSLAVGAISGIYQIASADNQSRYRGPVIESDAAINPGSDGGPLTDHRGRLLGVISLAFSRQRWQGVVVPVNACRAGLKRLPAMTPLRSVPDDAAERAAWAAQRILREAAASVAPAVVTVVYTDDPAALSAKRPDGPPAEHPPIPQPTHAAAEVQLPRPFFCSGLLIDDQGTVLTTAAPLVHAKEKPKAVRAYLADGRLAEARLLGFDTFHSIAALALSGDKLPSAARLTTSAGLRPGSALAVLGRSEQPGTLTFNRGICSATGRFDKTCTQISCLINHGNLGGPVIDLNGQVVGLATRLDETTSWRQNCGVGFMLDAQFINGILTDLKAGKAIPKPEKPYLGVQPDFAALDAHGARINKVLADGPAQKAGLQDGDVITSVNSREVTDWAMLLTLLQACKVGQAIPVEVQRNRQPVRTTLTLGRKE